jgi:hypothetical protein
MTRCLERTDFVKVVETAVRAPSLLNNQPWRFRLRDDGIDLLVDRRRLLATVDASGWGARIGCGAALFNLRLALAVFGKPAAVRLMPDPDDPYLVAALHPEPSRPAMPVERRLYQAITHRRSNRAPFLDKPVPLSVRSDLIAAAKAEDATLDLLVGPIAVEAAALLVRTADRVLAGDAGYQAELARWTHRSADAPDGVTAMAGGPAPGLDELLARRDFGDVPLPDHLGYEREPLLGVLCAAGDWPADQVRAGQALQRVLLTATDLGLAASLFSQPIEVLAVREQLRRVVRRGGDPQMFMRFGYATSAPPTNRRPIGDVIID